MAQSPDSESPRDQSRCSMCGSDLRLHEKALFVEEEVGRTFCSEGCITEYFSDDIQQLEKKYVKLRGKTDLAAEEREAVSHLRWITLQEPDEIWCDVQPSGDYRYTLISEFEPERTKIWMVCICLFLRGEPSFLYLAFPTKKRAVVDKFRLGQKIERVEEKAPIPEEDPISENDRIDRLAESWTEDETLRAEVQKRRNLSDIPMTEYSLYEHLSDPTLEAPDELWVQESEDGAEPDQYSFIRYFPNEGSAGRGLWYVITAVETEEAEQLEVRSQMPTSDPELVKQYRRGRSEQLVAQDDSAAQSRFVH